MTDVTGVPMASFFLLQFICAISCDIQNDLLNYNRPLIHSLLVAHRTLAAKTKC